MPPEPKLRAAHPEPQIPAPKPVRMHVHPQDASTFQLPEDHPARVNLRRVNQEIAVFRELRRRVLTGVYALGERLPSMVHIGEELGVTEPVVQKAVARLRELGLLRTVPGRGTWVVETITDRWQMLYALHAARNGEVIDDVFGPDAGPLIMFPASWIARLLEESESHRLI